jgi:hypothetical protein
LTFSSSSSSEIPIFSTYSSITTTFANSLFGFVEALGLFLKNLFKTPFCFYEFANPFFFFSSSRYPMDTFLTTWYHNSQALVFKQKKLTSTKSEIKNNKHITKFLRTKRKRQITKREQLTNLIGRMAVLDRWTWWSVQASGAPGGSAWSLNLVVGTGLRGTWWQCLIAAHDQNTLLRSRLNNTRRTA